jgi:hypothetical protein
VTVAQQGDTIALAAGTYLLERGDLRLTKSLTIAGAGPAATTIRQTGLDRVVTVEYPAGLQMNGVTITGGDLVGEPGEDGTEPGEDGEDGGAASGGGIAGGGPLSLTDVVVAGNGVHGGDGGDGVESETERGGDGGDGGLARGGGISGGNPVVLTRVAVTGNLTQPGSGGDGARATWSGYGGFGGAAGGSTGGAISIGAGSLTATDTLIAENQAGAAIGGNGADGGGELTGEGGAGGQGNGAVGGGIYAAGAVRLTNVTVSANTASGGTGGDAGDSPEIIRGRDGAIGYGGLGGGVALFDGAAGQLASVTVAGNRVVPGAGGEGGIGGLGQGGANEEPGSPGVVLPPAGGNLFVSAAGAEMRDTILAAGEAPAGSENCGHEREGTLSSSGHNLQDHYQCFTSTPEIGDLFGIPPGLGPLTDNGGPTRTMALDPGSPAVDAGEAGCLDALGQPLAGDQRGAPRAGVCDIGAFEVQPPPAEPVLAPTLSVEARLSALRVSPDLLRNGQRAVISFTLSAGARVRFVLKRRARGTKRRSRFVRSHGGPKAISADAGKTKRTWTPHGLRRGAYRLIATPGGGASRFTRFIVRK